jgi:hypothetical protein
MDAELDLDDLPPKVLRKMLRQMMGKTPKKGEEDANGKAIEKADEEREALADMHSKSRGAAPEIPVTKEDLPEEMRDQLEEEDDEEEEGEEEEESGSEKKPKKVKK